MADHLATPDATVLSSPAAKKKRSRQKWVFFSALVLIGSGLAVANTSLGGWALAQLIKKKTGMACTVGSLRTWPFSPGFSLRDLTLTRPLGADGVWQLNAPSVTSTIVLSDLWSHFARGRIVIDTVSVQQPHLRVILPTRSAAPEPPPAESPPADKNTESTAPELIPLADEATASPTPSPTDYETTGTGLTSLGKKKSIEIDTPTPPEPIFATNEPPPAETANISLPPTSEIDSASQTAPSSAASRSSTSPAAPAALPAASRRKIREITIDSASFEISHPHRRWPLLSGKNFNGNIPEASAEKKGHSSGQITQAFGLPLDLQLSGPISRHGPIIIIDQATMSLGEISGTFTLQAHLTKSGHPFTFGLEVPSFALSQLPPLLHSPIKGSAKVNLTLAGQAFQPKEWQATLQASVDDTVLPLAELFDFAGLNSWGEKTKASSFTPAEMQLRARAGGQMLVIDDCSLISPDVSWRASGIMRPSQEWALSSRLYLSEVGRQLAQSLTAEWPGERQWPLQPVAGSMTSFIDLPIGGTLSQPLFSLWGRPWTFSEWRGEYQRLEKMAGR